jgi:hypothetical protein
MAEFQLAYLQYILTCASGNTNCQQNTASSTCGQYGFLINKDNSLVQPFSTPVCSSCLESTNTVYSGISTCPYQSAGCGPGTPGQTLPYSCIPPFSTAGQTFSFWSFNSTATPGKFPSLSGSQITSNCMYMENNNGTSMFSVPPTTGGYANVSTCTVNLQSNNVREIWLWYQNLGAKMLPQALNDFCASAGRKISTFVPACLTATCPTFLNAYSSNMLKLGGMDMMHTRMLCLCLSMPHRMFSFLPILATQEPFGQPKLPTWAQQAGAGFACHHRVSWSSGTEAAWSGRATREQRPSAVSLHALEWGDPTLQCCSSSGVILCTRI